MLKNPRDRHLTSRKNYSNNSFDKNGLNVCSEENLKDCKEIKRSLRKRYLQKRLLLKESDLLNKSKKIADKLIIHPIFKRSQEIAFYSPINSEVDTSLIFERARLLGKNTYFPKVYKDNLRFFETSDINELKRSRFGINEPVSSKKKEIIIENIDLFLIPGICFDKSGNRIGFGKGYYDKTLRYIKSNKKIGLAFNFQIIDCIPKEFFDKHVGYIATESGVTKTYRGGR
jgi:5-formyltetrahydrofolate cyclo-ligase